MWPKREAQIDQENILLPRTGHLRSKTLAGRGKPWYRPRWGAGRGREAPLTPRMGPPWHRRAGQHPRVQGEGL